MFRKRRDVTVFESFEASPRAENVMATKGKLICSYPGPSIEVPNTIFDDENFLSELVNFLLHMNDDDLSDTAATMPKRVSNAPDVRDTTHPRYITELLTGILRSVGRPVEVFRVSKRIGDDVRVTKKGSRPWRRSPLWLLIRVALQTTLDRSILGRVAYKEFMLFFMCCLAKEKISANLSNDLLQFMSAKISRRLQKLGSSAPDWLSHVVLETCTSLRSTLDKRWSQVQAAHRVSPHWNPSQLDLGRDTQLPLSHSSDFLSDYLANHETDSGSTAFVPKRRLRGGLNEFLSYNGVFFKEVYYAEPHTALYDVERAVEQEIDRWIDQATKNDNACVQLEILADNYSSAALEIYGSNPELLSVMLLTIVELWVAIDRIAIKEIPILADYSPEISAGLLEGLLVCRGARVDRLHAYLSHRYSRSRHGWTVFSPNVTANTFAVRYYKGSLRLQHLKSQVEATAQREVDRKITELERGNAEFAELQRRISEIAHTHSANRDPDSNESYSRYCNKCDLERRQRNMVIAVHEWPLPAEQLRAEVVVFELDCPIIFSMWRTATFRLLVDICLPHSRSSPTITLENYSPFKPYLVSHARSRFTLAADTKPSSVSLSLPATRESVCVPNGMHFYGFDNRAGISVSEALGHADIRTHYTYQIQGGPYSNLQKYVEGTSHTSNEVIANQADCHADLSLHEFLAFGHLRSGGVLQWFNILRELRGRSLSFRRYEVHFLLAQAISQVGPLTNTSLSWHQELQQPAFCYALLEELESLLQDIEANWQEAVTMDTISLLLRRLLASSPDENFSLKGLELLRAVRSRVFAWVKELSTGLTGMPEDEEFRGHLRDCAAVCRGTFDVDPHLVPSLLNSAEDVEVLLTSAILIHDHMPSSVSDLSTYSQLLLDRDRRLSLALEAFLTDLLKGDSSDEGIDLAIGRVWHNYRPGSEWTLLQYPHSYWLSCTTTPTAKGRSKVVYFNLLDGSLLVDGMPLRRSPNEILQHPLYKQIFGEVSFSMPRLMRITDCFCSKYSILSLVISQAWITQRGGGFPVIR